MGNDHTESAAARPRKLLDLHAHFLPESYLEAAAAAGKAPEGRTTWPAWSFDDHLALMDQAGIAISVLSIAPPGIHFGENTAAAALASLVNDEAVSLVMRAPDRLRFLASLALPDVGNALAEWRRIREQPGCVGAIVLSHMLGVYIGDKRFDPLWAELSSSPTVVLVHPAEPLEPKLVSPNVPSATQEGYFESVRACMSMFESSLVTRFPQIRFVIPNCGGALPVMLNRMLTFGAAGLALDPRNTMREHLGLWFDCAGTPFPTQLPALLQQATIDRVVYGSECCFTPAACVLEQVAALEQATLPAGGSFYEALAQNGKSPDFEMVTADVEVSASSSG